MRYLILIGCALLSIIRGEPRDIPERDRILLNELKQLAENCFDAEIKAEFDKCTSFAQLVIDSQEAPQDIIDGMQAFLARWINKRSDFNVTDVDKISLDLSLAFSKESLFTNELRERGNLYTKGKFDRFYSSLRNASSNRMKAFRNTSIQKINGLSQPTKDSQNGLMEAFREFESSNKERDFYTFLTELRKY